MTKSSITVPGQDLNRGLSSLSQSLIVDYERGIARVNLNDVCTHSGEAFHQRNVNAIRENCTARIH